MTSTKSLLSFDGLPAVGKPADPRTQTAAASAKAGLSVEVFIWEVARFIWEPGR